MASTSQSTSAESRPSNADIKEHSYGVVPVALTSPPTLLLIQQRSKAQHWGIPKGHAEDGESPLTAAIRELEEETGLRATRFLRSPSASSSGPSREAHAELTASEVDEEQDGIQGEPYRNPRRDNQWKSNVYFVGLFDADVPAAGASALKLQEEEVEKAEWLDLDTAARRCTYEEGRQIVKRTQEWLKAYNLA